MSKLLTGFVAGIVVGILVAPDKGSETRKRITERTNDFKEKVEDLVCSIKDKFSTTVEEVEELQQNNSLHRM